MASEAGSEHMSFEDVVTYLDKATSDVEEEQIETHLARCDSCVERVRRAYELCRSWAGWTAETYRDALLRHLLRKALESAALEGQSSLSNLKKRIDVWLKQSAGLADGVVRVVLAKSRSTSKVITDGMDGLLRPEALWHFEPKLATGGVRGTIGSVAPDPHVTAEKGNLGAHVKVEQREGSNEIVVRLDGLPEKQAPPAVLLVSIGEEKGPAFKVAELKRKAGGLIARLEDVPEGDYMLAFEPIASMPKPPLENGVGKKKGSS